MILEGQFDSTANYLTELSRLSQETENEAVWFRGHGKSSYTLLPAIARDNRALEREHLLAKRFKQNAYPFRVSPPQDDWEWLFLMQHYGVPTRLLDWSESPLVALYFAVNDHNDPHDSEDGTIWALLPARYNYDVPRLRPTISVDIPCFGIDTALDDYRPDKIELETLTSKLPVAAIAHRQNKRIMAQLGVFTIMHRDSTPLEDIASDHLGKLVIPADAKATLRAELSALRVNRLSLFPELTSVAEVTKELLQ